MRKAITTRTGVTKRRVHSLKDPSRVYGWLLKLYPAGFREEYREPMEQQFRDDYREADEAGKRIRVWARAVADLTRSIPREVFHELRVDVGHSIRIYRKRPLATALAVIALATAIGASTGVFSVLNALLLRSLPFANPSELVECVLPGVSALSGRARFTEWSQQSAYLQNAATFSTGNRNLTAGRDGLRIKVTEASANFFQILGVNPIAGRTFANGEDKPGENAVAVISYGLWQQLFAADPSIAARTLYIDGAPFTVIGVAPPRFDYPDKTNVWTPTVFDFEKTPRRGAFLVRTIGRLKPGLSWHNARALYEAENSRANGGLLRTYGVHNPNGPRLLSLQDQLAGPVKQASLVLAGLTLLVLLTACANVAQLLVSRATERQQELALRTALGASRARLLQQLVTEASVLTVAGALLGLVVAYWASRLAFAVAPAQLETQDYTILDWRVLLFAVVLALAMGSVIGVLPAWLVGRLQPLKHLVRTQPNLRSPGDKKVRSGLLAVQTALALCLVTSSLTMGRTFLALIHADLGFRTANAVTLNVSLQGSRHHGGTAEWQYYSDALDQLRSVPGVKAAGAVAYVPLASNIYMAFAFRLDSGQTLQRILVNSVTPGYFRAMSTNILAGRDFERGEMQHSERSVIVNEALAQMAGLGQAIVGRQLIAPWGNNQAYRIVGLVSTARLSGPADLGKPEVYWPMQEEPPPAVTLVARVTGAPVSYLARCRNAVQRLDPSVPVTMWSRSTNDWERYWRGRSSTPQLPGSWRSWLFC